MVQRVLAELPVAFDPMAMVQDIQDSIPLIQKCWRWSTANYCSIGSVLLTGGDAMGLGGPFDPRWFRQLRRLL